MAGARQVGLTQLGEADEFVATGVARVHVLEKRDVRAFQAAFGNLGEVWKKALRPSEPYDAPIGIVVVPESLSCEPFDQRLGIRRCRAIMAGIELSKPSQCCPIIS